MKEKEKNPISADLFERISDLSARADWSLEELEESLREMGVDPDQLVNHVNRKIDELKASDQLMKLEGLAGDGEACPPFLGFLVDATGVQPSIIAKTLGVTVQFLKLVVQYRESVPNRCRERLVELASAQWAIDPIRVMRSLERPDPQQVAASRRSAYPTESISYQEILKRSGLDSETQKTWLALAEVESK